MSLGSLFMSGSSSSSAPAGSTDTAPPLSSMNVPAWLGIYSETYAVDHIPTPFSPAAPEAPKVPRPGDIRGLYTYFSRQARALKRKQKKNLEDSDSDELSWDAFTAALPGSAKLNTSLRREYDSFLSLITRWVGSDGNGPSFTLSAAYHVFTPLSTAVGSRTELTALRKSLESLLGPCQDKLFSDVVAQTTKLARTRESLIPASLPGTSSTTEKQSIGGGARDNADEFGASLPFNDPISSHFMPQGPAPKPVGFVRTPQPPSQPSGIARTGAGALTNDFFLVDPDDDGDDDDDDNDHDDGDNNQSAAPSSSSSSVRAPEFSWPWLVLQCEPLETFTPSGEPIVSAGALASSALALLQSGRSDAAVEGELVDLLGFSALDLVGSLLQARSQIRAITKEDIAAAQKADADALKKLGKPDSSTGAGGSTAAERRGADKQARRGAGVSVVFASSKAEAKRERLQLRRFMRMSEPDPRAGPSEGSSAAADARAAREKERQAANDAILRSLDAFKGDSETAGSVTNMLPAGTERSRTKEGWDVVHVPPPTLDALPDEDRIPVTAFTPLVQPALKGVARLNALQTRVFPCAYKSNENMLVCAPTGAGKTNVALMTILREIENNVVDGVLQTNDFKIVYVAPMKALAAEVTEKFTRSLAPLGVIVRELTGDMQLTKTEIMQTQMIVTTPEKWDVMTRKASDGSLIHMVRLLIIDEIHLLHEERGPVLEVLVARTQRNIETSQKLCRIVGLSATLPNYRDVGVFLGVNEQTGLFHFDGRYRPVPLDQYYIGVSAPSPLLRVKQMNLAAYERCAASLRDLNQVMVFVFSRNETARVAEFLYDEAVARGDYDSLFSAAEVPTRARMLQRASQICRTPGLYNLLQRGFGIHHGGMTRPERSFVEQAFMAGEIAVLVSTSTLAWGVNLPAHTVILRGTQIYDPKRGGFTDVSMLDVMQIFGRAGRPQFDKSGEAFLITSKDKLPHYLNLLCAAVPIESQMIKSLPDHLNAEIILGTVTNLREAEIWLTYTYLYVRMLRSPTMYGVGLEDIQGDPMLVLHRRTLILNAAKELMQCRMIKFDIQSGNFFPTDVGRVAALYYIHHQSVDTYNHLLQPYMTDEQIIDLIAHSREFSQLTVRQDETQPLIDLKNDGCPYAVIGDHTSFIAKANILLQCYISNVPIRSPTLSADSYFVQQSAGRIARALFEMVLRRGKSYLAAKLLEYCKMIDRRLWATAHPLRQFQHVKIPFAQLEAKQLWLDDLAEMDASDIDMAINSVDGRAGRKVKALLAQVPWLDVSASAQPLTRDVLRVTIKLQAAFDWNPRVHGASEPWWIWIEDGESEHIYHYEFFSLEKTKMHEEHVLHFTIPIFEPIPSQYVIRIFSDRWLGSDIVLPLSFKHLLLPDQHPPHTELLKLAPLPVTALQDPAAEALFAKKFTHFNPIQTQAFHTLYHSDENVLLGAPTGSGKTIIAELAILRALRMHPGRKVVYIAPMKALARERMDDWSSPRSLSSPELGVSVVELTGDVSPDPRALREADLLITTPEKWDGVSRNWQSRDYVSSVSLVIIDEIHLLGQDRGPVLEVIVSRMRYIASQTAETVRIIGLSTALANARDLADWLGIDPRGLFNFHPVMRPVPLTIYVSGFPGKFYCPRMATMNKPTYAAICTHSPTKPALVFVSSRRQTRLTGLDLVSFAAADGVPRRFLHFDSDDELEFALAKVKDASLKHLLSFGVGLHHAGLPASDRSLVEELYVQQKIQVLICTATLAWGVNLPAHLVVIKGTEYFDAKLNRYVDFPITDVLQMMGRAGRPQFDTEGKACVLVHEPKKPFYHKFLHSPFPVESSLHEQIHNHLCAEISAGTITSVSDAVDWLSWTFYFRRLLLNPSYYGLADASPAGARAHLLALILGALRDLEAANCVVLADANGAALAAADGVAGAAGGAADGGMGVLVEPTSLGALAAYYYIDYRTIARFCDLLTPETPLEGLLDAMCRSEEYAGMPVRHNEDVLNAELIKQLPHWPLPLEDSGEAYVKTSLLFQARWEGLPLPMSDYLTDTKSALDQSSRILHALADITADAGWLACFLRATTLMQMVVQAQWPWASPFAPLAASAGIPAGAVPRITAAFEAAGAGTLMQMVEMKPSRVAATVFAALTGTGEGQGQGHGQGKTMSRQNAERSAATFASLAACLPRLEVCVGADADWAAGSAAAAAEGKGKGKGKGKSADATTPEDDDAELEGTSLSVTGSSLRVGLCRRNPWTPLPASAQGPGAAASKARAAVLAALRRQEPAKVTGPRDVKTKKEGWWIAVGREDTDELVAVKRVTVGLRRTVATLELGEELEKGTYSVYVVSDCYLGLNQTIPFELV